MAIPLLAAAIPAVGSLLGGFFSSNAQQTANQENRDFAERMYKQQREDNLSMWNTQNEYNSPQAQMERLRKSGLNPNLVYGNGSAVNTASPVANATPSTPQAAAVNPMSGLPQAADSIYRFADLQQKSASTDNMRAQNTLLQQQAILNAVEAESKTFDVDLKKQLKQNVLDMASSSLEGIKASTLLKQTQQFGLSNDNWVKSETQDARIKALNLTPKVIEAQLNNTLSGTKLRQAELELKQLETNLRKNGINSSDPFYFRILGQFANKFGLTIQP